MGTWSCQEGGDGDSFGALSSCCRRRGKGQGHGVFPSSLTPFTIISLAINSPWTAEGRWKRKAELCIFKGVGIFIFLTSYFIYYYYFGCTGSSVEHTGFSCWEAWALEHVGSAVIACGLLSLWQCRPSSPASCGIPVPQTGIEPTSPALEGGFITAGLQGAPTLRFLK